LANDSGKSGSVGRETLDSVDNDDTVVRVVGDEELVSIRINTDSNGEIQSLAGGSRSASRGRRLSDHVISTGARALCVGGFVFEDSVVGTVGDVQVTVGLIDRESLGVPQGGGGSAGNQSRKVLLSKNSVGNNAEVSLSADTVVDQDASGGSGVRVEDEQSVAVCVVNDVFGTRQKEVVDGASGVDGGKTVRSDDPAGALKDASVVGGRRVDELEDSSESLVCDPEVVVAVNIDRVRVAYGTSFNRRA